MDLEIRIQRPRTSIGVNFYLSCSKSSSRNRTRPDCAHNYPELYYLPMHFRAQNWASPGWGRNSGISSKNRQGDLIPRWVQ